MLIKFLYFQTDSLAIAIITGRIVVTATSDGEPITVSPNADSYNDEFWHYITVTKEGRKFVDTKSTYSIVMLVVGVSVF